MSDFVEAIRKEWAVISGASWSFVTAIVVVAGALWIFMELIHSAEISGKDATIETQKAQIDSYKDKLSGATPDEAKAKIADLEARLAMVEPRRLSAEQRHAMASSFGNSGGSIVLSHDMTCADCAQYAADFDKILKEAHWTIIPSGVVGVPNVSSKGVTIWTSDIHLSPDAKALVDAFGAAKIPFDIIPTPPGQPQPAQYSGMVRILISPRATMP
jgi:hypothetical protein